MAKNMNNAAVQQILDECDADLGKVKAIIDNLGQTSLPVPYLTRYSIIKACGTIEAAYKNLLADYCSKRSRQQIKNYINSNVRDSSCNPTFSNMCKLLKEFDHHWNDNFKNLINSHPDKTALQTSLQSLVDARNDFAHGGSPTATITDVIAQYSYCRVVVEIIDGILI